MNFSGMNSTIAPVAAPAIEEEEPDLLALAIDRPAVTDPAPDDEGIADGFPTVWGVAPSGGGPAGPAQPPFVPGPNSPFFPLGPGMPWFEWRLSANGGTVRQDCGWTDPIPEGVLVFHVGPSLVLYRPADGFSGLDTIRFLGVDGKYHTMNIHVGAAPPDAVPGKPWSTTGWSSNGGGVTQDYGYTPDYVPPGILFFHVGPTTVLYKPPANYTGIDTIVVTGPDGKPMTIDIEIPEWPDDGRNGAPTKDWWTPPPAPVKPPEDPLPPGWQGNTRGGEEAFGADTDAVRLPVAEDAAALGDPGTFLAPTLTVLTLSTDDPFV
jgi:hypothetical protein